jgi:hypothetical protein
MCLCVQGREEFSDMWETYIQGADAFMLTVGANNSKSLNVLRVCCVCSCGRLNFLYLFTQDLIPRVIDAKEVPVIPAVIIITKTDIEPASWTVSAEEGMPRLPGWINSTFDNVLLCCSVCTWGILQCASVSVFSKDSSKHRACI